MPRPPRASPGRPFRLPLGCCYGAVAVRLLRGDGDEGTEPGDGVTPGPGAEPAGQAKGRRGLSAGAAWAWKKRQFLRKFVLIRVHPCSSVVVHCIDTA